jgi:regulator of protease activity HflC (stomatin/prohibitin superfamily)
MPGLQNNNKNKNERDKMKKQRRDKMEVLDVFIVVLLILGVAAVGFLFCTGSVPAGSVGVQNSFGSVSNDALPPGFVFKAPWVNIVPMSVQTQELKESADTPTDEGLTVVLDASILYHLKADSAANIYKSVGENYSPTVIEPQFRSIVRGVTADYDAKSLYTSNREEIAGKIQAQLEPALLSRGIVLENVLLRSVTLPQKVQDGIQAKLVADQDSQAMQFVLSKAKQEAERKVIEANGIAESQKIIDNSLTSQYLSWFWISNLDKYQSVIYVPVGSNAMPLFKDVDNTGASGWGKVATAFNVSNKTA